jgi:hypothetical protein
MLDQEGLVLSQRVLCCGWRNEIMRDKYVTNHKQEETERENKKKRYCCGSGSELVSRNFLIPYGTENSQESPLCPSNVINT